MHPTPIWDEHNTRCCHLDSHFFLTCCIDGLAFPSEDVLLFNMTLYSLYLFTYVDKLPWNWTSVFGVTFIDICGVFCSQRLHAFNPPRRGLPGFPFPLASVHAYVQNLHTYMPKLFVIARVLWTSGGLLHRTWPVIPSTYCNQPSQY